MRTFKISMLAAVLSVLAVVSVVYGQEPMTGSAFPAAMLHPSDTRLDSLESVIEMSEWKVQCAEVSLKEVVSTQPRTAGDRAKHMREVKEARHNLFITKAESHKAKAAWCYYYAELSTDEYAQAKARRSAYKHRHLAGGFMIKAASVTGSELPTIEHKGRLKLTGIEG